MCGAPVAAHPHHAQVQFFILAKPLRLVFDTAALRRCFFESFNKSEMLQDSPPIGICLESREEPIHSARIHESGPMTAGPALPIGIFDSGIGGLTVVREIHRALPHEDLVYLGDTARVPYGTKSPGTIVRFACEDTQFLVQQNVKAVVVACNTASAWALPALERMFDVPIFGVILPGVQAALTVTRNRRIGIIGTATTIRSQAYTRAILALDDTAKVFTRACPLLVPLVEAGWSHHQVTAQILQLYLAPLLQRRIDTLVLGCTHYPLLKEAIRASAGKGVKLVDSAKSCAQFLREHLQNTRLLARRQRRVGTIQPFVTDEVEGFDQLARRFLGRPTEPASKVELPTMAAAGVIDPAGDNTREGNSSIND